MPDLPLQVLTSHLHQVARYLIRPLSRARALGSPWESARGHLYICAANQKPRDDGNERCDDYRAGRGVTTKGYRRQRNTGIVHQGRNRLPFPRRANDRTKKGGRTLGSAIRSWLPLLVSLLHLSGNLHWHFCPIQTISPLGCLRYRADTIYSRSRRHSDD